MGDIMIRLQWQVSLQGLACDLFRLSSMRCTLAPHVHAPACLLNAVALHGLSWEMRSMHGPHYYYDQAAVASVAPGPACTLFRLFKVQCTFAPHVHAPACLLNAGVTAAWCVRACMQTHMRRTNQTFVARTAATASLQQTKQCISDSSLHTRQAMKARHLSGTSGWVIQGPTRH